MIIKLMKTFMSIFSCALILFASGCVIAEYATKTKDTLIKGTNYIGEKVNPSTHLESKALGLIKRNKYP